VCGEDAGVEDGVTLDMIECLPTRLMTAVKPSGGAT
jgi:hypothetical protein